jgi:hypothetical protein
MFLHFFDAQKIRSLPKLLPNARLPFAPGFGSPKRGIHFRRSVGLHSGGDV